MYKDRLMENFDLAYYCGMFKLKNSKSCNPYIDNFYEVAMKFSKDLRKRDKLIKDKIKNETYQDIVKIIKDKINERCEIDMIVKHIEQLKSEK